MGTRTRTVISPEQAIDHYAELVIATGVITVPGPGVYIVTAESGITDNLDGIVGGSAGDRIILVPGHSGGGYHTITVRNGIGGGNPIFTGTGLNIALRGDITAQEASAVELMLITIGTVTAWYVLGVPGAWYLGSYWVNADSSLPNQVIRGQAAYCDPASCTAGNIATALIAAGLMHAAP